MYGYHGKFLLVDLSKMDIIEKELEQDVLYSYLGGRGLGSYLLSKLLTPGEDPLSPRNVLIFAAGPATDSALKPTAGYGVFTKSPATGLFTEAYCNGLLPPQVKKTGYDALVITGAASRPSFITISEFGVNFYDASEIWGSDTISAEKSILNVVGGTDSEALVIGPAGEHMISAANIRSSAYRNFGRAGIGAVFGSKNLKGLVFRGGARAAQFNSRSELAEWNSTYANLSADEFSLIKPDLADQVKAANQGKYFPSGYWVEGELIGWEGLVSELRSQKIENGNLDYLSFNAFGGLCRLTNLKEIIKLVDLCSRLGLDPISAGNLASFAAWARQIGKLDEAPFYGRADSIELFLESVATAKGEGALFSGGAAEAARILDLEEAVIHLHGLEPAGYDPRVVPAAGLVQMTAGFGEFSAEAFVNDQLSRFTGEDNETYRLPQIFVDYEDQANIMDSIILQRCYQPLLSWQDLISVIYNLTGERYSAAILKSISNLISSTIRLFNLDQGAASVSEKMPPRLLKEPINDDQNIFREKELELMLKNYYLLRGWNDNGFPDRANQNHQLLLRRTNKCL